MRPAIVMPMHDPDGILFPHLKRAIPFLKQAFARGYLSVTAVTLARQPDWAAWLDGEPFFDVLTGSDAARPGDQFAELYRHAAAVSPPEQALHLGFVDRVVYALGSDFRDAYLADVERRERTRKRRGSITVRQRPGPRTRPTIARWRGPSPPPVRRCWGVRSISRGVT